MSGRIYRRERHGERASSDAAVLRWRRRPRLPTNLGQADCPAGRILRPRPNTLTCAGPGIGEPLGEASMAGNSSRPVRDAAGARPIPALGSLSISDVHCGAGVSPLRSVAPPNGTTSGLVGGMPPGNRMAGPQREQAGSGGVGASVPLGTRLRCPGTQLTIPWAFAIPVPPALR